MTALACVLLGGAFLYGALAHRNDLPPIPQIRTAVQMLRGIDADTARHPRHLHLQPSRGQGSGVTVNEKAGQDDTLVMLAGFFDEENQIRLIRRDGSVVKKWGLDYHAHFPDAETRACEILSPLRVDTHGAHVTPSGEAVFNYEYCGSIKIDHCGEPVWRINGPTHHSLVPAEAGGYWILGRDVWSVRENPDRFPPFSTPGTDEFIHEDTLLRVSEDGEILDEISIPGMMRDNGLEALLTANGDDFGRDRVARIELVHSNKAAELPSDRADAFPLFSAGDLAISMRELNLVMVVDPEARVVKWEQTGPWLRQHDPEFRADGKLSIFNNNAYRTAYPDNQTDLSAPRTSNIMTVDPVTGVTEVVFGQKQGQEMLSVIRGQHELLEDGGMLITEFDGGRVIETDADGRIVWEYVNEYDAENVGEITNAAVFAADYFTVDWGACAQ